VLIDIVVATEVDGSRRLVFFMVCLNFTVFVLEVNYDSDLHILNEAYQDIPFVL